MPYFSFAYLIKSYKIVIVIFKLCFSDLDNKIYKLTSRENTLIFKFEFVLDKMEINKFL